MAPTVTSNDTQPSTSGSRLSSPTVTSPIPGQVGDGSGQPDPLNPTTMAAPLPARHAVYRGGIVYLRGTVPSREVSQAIESRAEAVVGEGNVVNEHVVDPQASKPSEGTPLYVEDTVLFESGSADIAPQFVPILDLGLLLMAQNPAVSIEVVGHTDTAGAEDFNLRLSLARAESVVAYWVDRGIGANRLSATARGEWEPVESNTSSLGAASNRRAEFIISGLLD